MIVWFALLVKDFPDSRGWKIAEFYETAHDAQQAWHEAIRAGETARVVEFVEVVR